jgi:catechol 2,3-dioxygenase-like lactoylglutathione lyase family enzyme
MGTSAGIAHRVQGVHHIGISVPDLAKAREFYIDLLGGVEEVEPLVWADNPFIDAVIGLQDSAAKQFMCRLGNTHLEVFEYSQPRSVPQDPDKGVHNFGYTHFALQVDDILAVHDRLVDAGIRIHAPPSMAGITTDADGTKRGYAATYCRDPVGNVFEIMEIHECDDMMRV